MEVEHQLSLTALRIAPIELVMPVFLSVLAQYQTCLQVYVLVSKGVVLLSGAIPRLDELHNLNLFVGP